MRKDEGAPKPAVVEVISEDGLGTKVTVKTNVHLVPSWLQYELQTILDYARLSLQAIDGQDSFTGKFEDTSFHLDPAQNRRMALPELKEETRQWILALAVHAAMELPHEPLERAHLVFEAWNLSPTATLDEARQSLAKDSVKFHLMKLAEKLAYLEKRYGFVLKPHVVEAIQSLHKLRNCVGHRNREVTPLDTRGAPALTAVWQEVAMFVQDDTTPQGYHVRRLEGGLMLPAGTRIAMGRQRKVTEFPVGTRLVFTTRDLTEICNTIYVFALEVRDELRRKGEARGIPMPPTDDNQL